MTLLLNEEIEVYWNNLHNLESYLSRNYFDETFLKLLNSLFTDINLYSHAAISQSFFKILLLMLQMEKFKTIAYGLLRRPFGLISQENRVGFVKCSMALTNSLPFEHYSQLISCFIDRFHQDSSFLVVSEEWGKLSQGLQMASRFGLVLSQTNLELANASEEDRDVLGLIPTNYIELLVSKACWEDPLLAKLAQTRQDVFDCACLTALIQFKTKGYVVDSLILFLKQSSSHFPRRLIGELVKIDPTAKLIIDNFISNYKLNLDL